MRFKNLTTTRTLAYLTIVAIAGLTFLPITGNCQIINHGWTSSTEYAKSFKAIKPDRGDSWIINASVNAKGVSASVDPSSHNVDQFSSDCKYIGNGHVNAWRSNYTWYHGYWRLTGMCDNFDKWSRCQGHNAEGDIDTNIPTHPDYNDGNTSLTLEIQMAKVTYVDLTVKHTDKTTEIINQVGLNHYGATLGRTWTYKEREVTTDHVSTAYTVKIPKVAQDVGVSASVSFDSQASSTAYASFSFQGISDSGAKEYTPSSP